MPCEIALLLLCSSLLTSNNAITTLPQTMHMFGGWRSADVWVFDPIFGTKVS
jgi:hypothetical protein